MADIVATIGADQSQLERGLGKARAKVNGWASSVSKSASGALGGILGGAALIATSKAIVDNFANIAKEAKKTGLGTDEIQQLQAEAEQADTSLEMVLDSLRKFQTFKGTEEQAEAFKRMGMDLDEVKKKVPIEQFRAFAKVIAGAGNEQDQLKAIGVVLGDTKGKFQDLLPLLQKVATEGFDPIALASEKTIAEIAKLDDQIAGLKQELMVSLAPGLVFVTNLFILLFDSVKVVTDSVGALIGGLAGAGASLSDWIESLFTFDKDQIQNAADRVEKAFSDAHRNTGEAAVKAAEKAKKSLDALMGKGPSPTPRSPIAPTGSMDGQPKQDFSGQKKYATGRIGEIEKEIAALSQIQRPTGLLSGVSVGSGQSTVSSYAMPDRQKTEALLKNSNEILRDMKDILEEIEQREGGLAE